MAATQRSAHEEIIVLMLELIGISIIAIVADTSETIGKIALAVMSGWLLLWLISGPGAGIISSQTKKLGG